MTIRGEILTEIREATKTIVAHCDIWNNNVAFIESEQAWATPALFVEFESMELKPTKGEDYYVRSGLILHIVTDADTPAEERYQKVDDVIKKVSYLMTAHASISGPRFIDSNHDHGDIVEEIVRLEYSANVKY